MASIHIFTRSLRQAQKNRESYVDNEPNKEFEFRINGKLNRMNRHIDRTNGVSSAHLYRYLPVRL